MDFKNIPIYYKMSRKVIADLSLKRAAPSIYILILMLVLIISIGPMYNPPRFM